MLETSAFSFNAVQSLSEALRLNPKASLTPTTATSIFTADFYEGVTPVLNSTVQTFIVDSIIPNYLTALQDRGGFPILCDAPHLVQWNLGTPRTDQWQPASSFFDPKGGIIAGDYTSGVSIDKLSFKSAVFPANTQTVGSTHSSVTAQISANYVKSLLKDKYANLEKLKKSAAFNITAIFSKPSQDSETLGDHLSEVSDGVLVLDTHGTTGLTRGSRIGPGYIFYKGREYSLPEMLNYLIDTYHINKRGIHTVLTTACFGAFQQEFTRAGVTIKPMYQENASFNFGVTSKDGTESFESIFSSNYSQTYWDLSAPVQESIVPLTNSQIDDLTTQIVDATAMFIRQLVIYSKHFAGLSAALSQCGMFFTTASGLTF